MAEAIGTNPPKNPPKKYKITDFFNTVVEGELGHRKLVIYHREGCQTIDFGSARIFPRQTEVLTELKVLGTNLAEIDGLQYGRKNKYTLYPKGNKPLLKQKELILGGQRAKITDADPIIRDIEMKLVDLYISGLPLEIRTEVVTLKLQTQYGIHIGSNTQASCWGHKEVLSGERVVKVQPDQAAQVPAYFYVLGFLCRTWYRGCDKHRPCPKCKVMGHGPKFCPAVSLTRDPNSYAAKVAGDPEIGNEEPEEQLQLQQQQQQQVLDTQIQVQVQVHAPQDRQQDEPQVDRQEEILPQEDRYVTPKKTTRREMPTAPLKTGNRFEGLPIEEIEMEELGVEPMQSEEETDSQGKNASTPIVPYRKRKNNTLSGTSTSDESQTLTEKPLPKIKLTEKTRKRERKRRIEEEPPVDTSSGEFDPDFDLLPLYSKAVLIDYQSTSTELTHDATNDTLDTTNESREESNLKEQTDTETDGGSMPPNDSSQ